MTKQELTASAKSLSGFSPEAASEYSQQKDILVTKINDYMLARQDINELVGKENIEMMKDNHANHGLFIASMLSNYDPNVLVETIGWVFKAYRSRNFHPNYWAAQLHAWQRVMKEHLSPESYENIRPLYDWMTINIPQFSAMTDEYPS